MILKQNDAWTLSSVILKSWNLNFIYQNFIIEKYKQLIVIVNVIDDSRA